MQSLAQAIAGFLSIDPAYAYLSIGIAIGFVLPPLLKLLLGRRGTTGAGSKTVMVAEARGSIDVEIDGQTFDIDAATMAKIRALADKGNRIEAIKGLREATGLGLAEAKQIVEALERLKN